MAETMTRRGFLGLLAGAAAALVAAPLAALGSPRREPPGLLDDVLAGPEFTAAAPGPGTTVTFAELERTIAEVAKVRPPSIEVRVGDRVALRHIEPGNWNDIRIPLTAYDFERQPAGDVWIKDTRVIWFSVSALYLPTAEDA